MSANTKDSIRVQLTDHERRDLEPGYKFHIVWASREKFPTKESQDGERLRLRAAQKAKNDQYAKRKLYDKLSVDVKPKEAITTLDAKPSLPKYESTCTLKLDEGTGNTVLLVASSKAGKTTLQMDLYAKYFKKSIAIMFAHNVQLKIYKEGAAKKLIVTDQFEPDIVEIMRKLNKYSDNKFAFTCLFDDQLKVRNDVIQDLFLSLRNSNISSLISLQYVNLMSKACRGNVNTVLGGSMNSDENILVFVKCYLQTYMHSLGLKSEPAMIAWYRELTLNHGFVNIHPASGSITFCRLRLDKK